MTQDAYFIISVLLLVVGIVGTILPAVPGLILCLIGVLVYKFAVNPEFSTYIVIGFALLTIASFVLEYYLPMRLTKKYGGSRYGSIASGLGAFAGLFLIPVPFGFLIGMAIGAFAGEMIKDSTNPKVALQAAKGSLIGFLISSGAQFALGIMMLISVLLHYW